MNKHFRLSFKIQSWNNMNQSEVSSLWSFSSRERLEKKHHTHIQIHNSRSRGTHTITKTPEPGTNVRPATSSFGLRATQQANTHTASTLKHEEVPDLLVMRADAVWTSCEQQHWSVHSRVYTSCPASCCSTGSAPRTRQPAAAASQTPTTQHVVQSSCVI